MPISKNSFPCTACGKCCKNVNLNTEVNYLNRGDGTCRHFDDKTNLCLIYEDRPLVCRVEDYYDKHLKDLYEWDGFVKMNVDICKQLQEKE